MQFIFTEFLLKITINIYKKQLNRSLLEINSTLSYAIFRTYPNQKRWSKGWTQNVLVFPPQICSLEFSFKGEQGGPISLTLWKVNIFCLAHFAVII